MGDQIDYVTIATNSIAIDFGDLTVSRKYFGGSGSQIRGIFGGGDTAPGAAQIDTIDYVTIASTGNATDFGNLLNATQHVGSCSSPTRSIFAGGATPTLINVIQFHRIQ